MPRRVLPLAHLAWTALMVIGLFVALRLSCSGMGCAAATAIVWIGWCVLLYLPATLLGLWQFVRRGERGALAAVSRALFPPQLLLGLGLFGWWWAR